MISLWNDTEAAACKSDLELRAYTSRLLGREPALVLHGGGNTSVKIRQPNLFGEPEEVLYVKGSGSDLDSITPAGFAPVRMTPLLRLATLKELSDAQMASELRCALVTSAAPNPSVEAILHAVIPDKFVDHTHTEALISVMNTPAGEKNIREIYGDRVVVIPYVMPGFRLARLAAELFPPRRHAGTVGMVLMNHGLFTFADTARESYERMVRLVSEAEEFLRRRGAWEVTAKPAPAASRPQTRRIDLATLRRDVSRSAGFPMLLRTHDDAAAMAFVARSDLATIARQGPATPDHVIRTKRLPLVGRDVAAYAREYTQYFEVHRRQVPMKLKMLDPAPRVILDRELGILCAGRTAKDVGIVADIYRRTVEVILRSVALGGWQALPPLDIFEVEYWDLEQEKLRKSGRPLVFAGEVALVTGAASGIGRACVESLLARGAAVVGLDLDRAVTAMLAQPDFLGIRTDVCDSAAVSAALDQAVERFGGLDMLILNAGIFPPSAKIQSLDPAMWRKTMAINLDANFQLLQSAHPLLKLAPGGGRVVVIGSKNVPAPGAGAGAYSASKAALTQLVRVAALEWGEDGIRVNIVHPNAVFDTGIWTPEVLAARAKAYGLSVEQYKTNNVLKVEVVSRDVAEMAAEMCGPVFARTTASQVPVDGGNDRVI